MYATRAELAEYAPQVVGTDPELDELLKQASLDLDRFIGVVPRSATAVLPFKWDLAALDATSAEGIKRATMAQAEFRDAMGPDHFVGLAGTTIQGPDFTITSGGGFGGGSHNLGPKTIQELISFGLIPTTARARP